MKSIQILFLIFVTYLPPLIKVFASENVELQISEDVSQSYKNNYPVPESCLTKTDIKDLAKFWFLDSDDIKTIQMLSWRPLAEWVKPQNFENLHILCYLEQEFYLTVILNQKIRLAALTLFQIVDDLMIRGMYLRKNQFLEEGNQRIIKLLQDKKLPLDFDPVRGLWSDTQLDFAKFQPLIPILQKLTRNLFKYYNFMIESQKQYGKKCDSIEISSEKKCFLGYINNFLPVAYEKEEPYGMIYLPYKPFNNLNQNMVLTFENNLITDSGFLIKNSRLDPFQDLSGVEIYLYLGKHYDHSFSYAPYHSFKLQGTQNLNENKMNKKLEQLQTFFEKDIPGFNRLNFIPFPSDPLDKDIFELLFLEELKSKMDQDNIAYRMIEYIEFETDAKVDEIIVKLQQSIIQHQLEIIHEQEEISQHVANGTIIGKLKAINFKQTQKWLLKNNKVINKSHITDQVSKDISADVLKFEKHKHILEELKVKKRIKYRKMLNIINKVMKHAVEQKLLPMTKGSHNTLHTSLGAATLVKKHGKKDTTLASGTSIRFYEKLTAIMNLKND